MIFIWPSTPVTSTSPSLKTSLVVFEDSGPERLESRPTLSLFELWELV